MNRTTVYLVGRPKDLNNTMSLCHDGVRITLPNYTEVFAEPPARESISGDQAIFALQVAEDRLHTQKETSREHRQGRDVTRLWDGPRNARNLPQNRVAALISVYDETIPTKLPPEKDIRRLQQANEDLLAMVGDLKAGGVAAIKRVILASSEEDIKAMPYIGDENVEHLRNWAAEE